MRYYYNNKMIERYSNYNSYALNKDMPRISEERLVRAIEHLLSRYGSPYLRFTWVSDAVEPMCVLYNKGDKLSKLVQFKTFETL